MRVEAGSRSTSAQALAIAAAGSGALLLRLKLLPLPEAMQALALAFLFVGLGAASLLAPAPVGIRRLSPVAVAAIGLIGIGAAYAVAGRGASVPTGAWTIPLVLLGAVSEELLFRRLAYGAIAGLAGEGVAVIATAVAFALLHVPLYGAAAFPVDLGAGLLLSWQRWASGSWTLPAVTHAAANLLVVMR